VQVPEFKLEQPRDLSEAFIAAAKAGDHGFDWLGGGTDLLCNYKWQINVKPTVISLKQVAELQNAEPGSLASGRTLWSIEHDSVLRQKFPAICAAAAMVASPLIRRSATLGGNLHLDTRCWHFNQSIEWRRAHDSCLKAEADQCRVMPVPGDLCVATYSGDLAPVLMAYGAIAECRGPAGARQVALSDYYAADGIRRFASKAPDEVMVGLNLPADAQDWTVRYQKLRLRETFDFPEGGVAVGLRWQDQPGGVVADARVVTTAYDSVPLMHPEVAQALLGQRPTLELAEQIGTTLMNEVRPMKNTSMSPAYRRKMARVLCKRAILACLPQHLA
jgi:4-hydroxybenzoyl-CoA reductase subunit beta